MLAVRAEPSRSGWGGARNRADRASEHLTGAQCEAMIAGALHAERTSHPLSRHWTVHHERAGVPMAEGAVFVTRLLSGLRAMARREAGELVAVWSREGGTGKGAHVHILMHLPPGMTLRNRTRRLIEGAGGTWRRGVSKVRTIGGRLSPAASEGRRFANAMNVLGYILKTADPDAGRALDLPSYGASALVIGKRCGWTQNVGAKARGVGKSPP